MPERICAHSELHQKASFLGWLLKFPQPPAAAPDSFNPLHGDSIAPISRHSLYLAAAAAQTSYSAD